MSDSLLTMTSDYDDYYDDDYEYDPYSHMTNDPLDYYTHGYGGFGYDTSHVKKDESRTELFKHASGGNFSEVKRIVEAARGQIRKRKEYGHQLREKVDGS